MCFVIGWNIFGLFSWRGFVGSQGGEPKARGYKGMQCLHVMMYVGWKWWLVLRAGRFRSSFVFAGAGKQIRDKCVFAMMKTHQV